MATSNERFRVKVSEILEIQKRKAEINDNELSNVDFIDDDGNVIVIEQKILDDWKYTGLNLTDFIATDFYKRGFETENIKK